ncbi:MAG: hypothetical protein IH985_08165 [Planctomycetes bacterium]|nr:hypothetical protein [Planctomycetota bacterium]
MIPSAAEIIRKRESAAFILAIFGIVCYLIGLIPLVLWLGEGLRDADLFDLSYYLEQILFAFVFLINAAIFTFLRRPLAAWLIRPRPLECPACSYRLERLTIPRCPECGLVLTDEFLDPTPSSDDSLSE